ncbi:MAG: hypothetical protein K0Q83_3419 [Deltaproteobacteria bacterium]|jgi:hypothetical protein|nr:hypothetical protein [Deltaproteobacteria bacterium]
MIQIISMLESNATNAAVASKMRGMSHEISEMNRTVTVSRSPTKEHKIAQWYRFQDPKTTQLPEIGADVELFGWEKWNTQVVEVLELTCRKDGTK